LTETPTTVRVPQFIRILLMLVCAGAALPALGEAPAKAASSTVPTSPARGSGDDRTAVMTASATGTAGDESRLPVARSVRTLSTVVGVAVAIDGSGSHDANGQRIVFQWTVIEAPSGSIATLDADDPAPVFTADEPGTYVLQLIVTNEDGLQSRAARTTLIAFESRAPPNTRIGQDRDASVGAEVRLNAGASFDPLDSPLTFLWSMISAPFASTLTDRDILRRETPDASFTPDVAGPFVLGLEASNGELASEDRVTITATQDNLAPVADAGDHQARAFVEPITLHGEGSFDPDAGPAPLGFQWSLVARPTLSSVTSSEPSAASDCPRSGCH